MIHFLSGHNQEGNVELGAEVHLGVLLPSSISFSVLWTFCHELELQRIGMDVAQLLFFPSSFGVFYLPSVWPQVESLCEIVGMGDQGGAHGIESVGVQVLL